MKFKHIVPKMEGTFGTLEYAGKKEEVTGRVNGQRKIVGRKYHLYAEKQPADNIEVIIPIAVAEKNYGYEDKVELIKPRIIAEGKKVGDSGYTDYVMFADDMKKIQ